MSENKVTLMGFDGCPNIAKSQELLEKLDISYQIQIVTEDEAKSIPQYYGSPSFLVGGKNIEEGEHGWACRIVNWNTLENLLQQEIS